MLRLSVVAAARLMFVLLFIQSAAVDAGEVKLLCVVALGPTLDELVPQFERATGHKLAMQYGSSPTFKQQIEAGAPFDLAILTAPVINDLIKQDKVVGATRAVIARSGIGVAVRAGAPSSDISSVDAFKRALLTAKSVAYAPEGAISLHLPKVFDRLGITEQIKVKTKLQKSVDRVLGAVANGEAELGFATTGAILSVRGTRLLGPFPPELQDYVVLTAGVGSAAKEPEGAKALIKFLTAPAAVPVIKAKGMEPGTP
jgi:molybdate transport system substrate-binding protein